MSRSLTSMSLLALLSTGALSVGAQTLPPPQNVLQLSATATQEVPQDLLAITMTVQRDGADAAAVQSQLKQVLDAALAEARKAARPGQVEVRTGTFALYPRYAQKGGTSSISGWQGRADLVLEGRDMPAISQLSGRLAGMVVGNVGYALSRETRDKVEADVAAQAITRFKARAEGYAKQFGFGSYSIREVTVGQSDAIMVMPAAGRVRAMSASVAADEALPVEAGKANVSVNVNGSIQMSPR